MEDHRFDYIETGSLISIKKNVDDILIPSEEDGIEMYPMDFEEFMWAMGDEVMYPYIRRCFETNKPMGDFHREAMRYFRQYLIVGGMPQAVKEYVNSKDFNKVDAIKRQILRLYRNDIKKYKSSLIGYFHSLSTKMKDNCAKRKERQETRFPVSL